MNTESWQSRRKNFPCAFPEEQFGGEMPESVRDLSQSAGGGSIDIPDILNARGSAKPGRG